MSAGDTRLPAALGVGRLGVGGSRTKGRGSLAVVSLSGSNLEAEEVPRVAVHRPSLRR